MYSDVGLGLLTLGLTWLAREYMHGDDSYEFASAQMFFVVKFFQYDKFELITSEKKDLEKVYDFGFILP